jgi:2-polyprenyl-3-methyl-5-hydroxy-6-metoxy-1,4-benzoquinol methylase
MKIGAIPEGVLEKVALATGLAAVPVLDTLLAAGLARTLMVASKLGVFAALADGPRSAAAIAHACSTDAAATAMLLEALVGCEYVRRDGDAFALAPVARNWLLPGGKRTLHDHMLLMELVWHWLEHYEEFVRTGRPLDVHRDLDEAGWALYQRGMRSLAALGLDEFGLRTPVPRHATALLDIGGSHGAYAARLCRRHERLTATVLDLPEATRQCADLVRAEGLGDRLRQREGDARTDDLGHECWDVVLVSNLVHHFDAATNRALLARIESALRPGGVVVVQEPMRTTHAEHNQIGALGGLYFAMLSASATWTARDIAGWQRAAGLQPKRPMRFRTVPSLAQQSATKR